MEGKKDNLDSLVKLSIVIACTSVAIYFLLIKPNLERERFNFEKQIELTKQQELQKKKEELKKSLDDCLYTATINYKDSWNLSCKQFDKDKKSAGCVLPAFIATGRDESFDKERERCYKWYGEGK